MEHPGRPPQPVVLDEPRPLGDHERRLLDALLAGPRSRPELIQQAATARVAAVCSCGCPSVWLAVESEAPPLLATAADGPTGAPGYFSLTAHGTDAAGREVSVTLHVGDGHLVELEIWGNAEGATRLPPLEILRFSTDS